MKWCFLINNVSYLMEFLGKFSRRVVKEGDECIILANSKIAEYDKRKYFPENVKFLSKVDWCIKNYKNNQEEFDNLSWREFFPTFDRKTKLKLFKFNYNNSIEIISQLCQFINFVFHGEKPDVVINEVPSNIFSKIAYYLCGKNNITYLGLMGSRFNGRTDIYDLEHTCSEYEASFHKLSTQDISFSEKNFAENFIKDFISHKQLSSGTNDLVSRFYETNLIKYYSGRLRRICWSRFNYFLNRKRFKSFDYESEATLNSSLRAPYEAFKRKLKIFFQKNIFKELKKNGKFFFFPLHFQPESSTSALATYFCDQLNTVRNIAFSLPLPYKLYVKEHPIAIGTRSNNFYKELKKIPNVVLISPHEDVESLIKRSEGVITLTSTIGMEAALAGKPVYVLGNVFYVYHPLCRKVNNFEELGQKIQVDLINKPITSNLEEINIRFVVSYFKNTIPGDIIAASDKKDTNNYKVIYGDIKKMFLE